MPRETFGANHQFLPSEKILSYDEIETIARQFVALGVKKIRLTGGEPLVRPKLPELVKRLAQLPGLEDISLTTNGSLLTRENTQQLKDAGLHRITISLDALDDATFMAINDVKFPVQQVLDAIENTNSVGFESIKINMVVKKGINEHSVLPMAEFFRGTGHALRFIEFMDVGNSNQWQADAVLSVKEIVELIDARFPIEPLEANYPGEVAQRWRYRDGEGEIGIISSITQPFCHSCTRARVSAEGQLYTCLFATQGNDLRQRIREGMSDEQLRDFLASVWSERTDRYSELRTLSTTQIPKIEMSYIGG
jgi:cyclic pyranopterin phosphate synthase